MDFKCNIYFMDELVGRLELSNGKLIRNEVYTDNVLMHPCPNSHTYIHVMNTLRDRAIPKCRCDDYMLRMMGLKRYDVLGILRSTHGVVTDDFIWFKFDDDKADLCCEEVRASLCGVIN